MRDDWTQNSSRFQSSHVAENRRTTRRGTADSTTVAYRRLDGMIKGLDESLKVGQTEELSNIPPQGQMPLR